MAMTFTFSETRLLINGICASPVAVEGATKTDFPPISFCASAAPSPVALKYGSVSSFGIKPIVKSAPTANPVVQSNQEAERERDQIPVEKYDGDTGPAQFFRRSLTDLVFVGGKFERCEEDAAYIAADEVLANFLGIVDGQVRGLFAVRPQEAVVSGSCEACKFLANKIQDFGYLKGRQKHPQMPRSFHDGGHYTFEIRTRADASFYYALRLQITKRSRAVGRETPNRRTS